MIYSRVELISFDERSRLACDKGTSAATLTYECTDGSRYNNCKVNGLAAIFLFQACETGPTAAGYFEACIVGNTARASGSISACASGLDAAPLPNGCYATGHNPT